MAPRINLVGQRFGYLTVTKQVEPQLYQWRKRRAPLRVPQYEVKCDCGTVKITKAKLPRNWVPAISGIQNVFQKKAPVGKGTEAINNRIEECQKRNRHPPI